MEKWLLKWSVCVCVPKSLHECVVTKLGMVSYYWSCQSPVTFFIDWFKGFFILYHVRFCLLPLTWGVSVNSSCTAALCVIYNVPHTTLYTLSVCLSVWLTVCLSVCLSLCLSDWLTDWLSISLTICLSVWLTDCLSLCLSVCLSVCLCLSVWLTDCLSVCQYL